MNRKLENQSTCHIFFEKYSLFIMLYTLWSSIVFSPKQIHLPNCQSCLLRRQPVIFLLKPSKEKKKKRRNPKEKQGTCHQRGDSGNLTCHSRRQGSVCGMWDVRWSLGSVCTNSSRQGEVWLLYEPSLNFSDSSCDMKCPPPPSPHPELLSCFTKRRASDGDLVPLRCVTEGW